MAEHEKQREPESTPPGHFVSEEQRAQTARFLDELRQRLTREKPTAEPKLGPPRRPR